MCYTQSDDGDSRENYHNKSIEYDYHRNPMNKTTTGNLLNTTTTGSEVI